MDHLWPENGREMMLHKRTMLVQRIEAEIETVLWQMPALRKLTPIELTGILIRVAGHANTMALRLERHPDDPDRKADESGPDSDRPRNHAVQGTQDGA